jgi:hypothetical protein
LRASSTALITAGGEATQPASPIPFAVRVLAMTDIDWTIVGSAVLLVRWFGFLLLLLYL